MQGIVIVHGSEVQGSRFKVQGSRFKVQGSRFKVQGSAVKNPSFLKKTTLKHGSNFLVFNR